MIRPLLALLLLVPLFGCQDEPITFAPEAESLSSFSANLDGWVPIDLGLVPGSSFSVVPDAGTALFEVDVPGVGGEAVVAREYVLTPEVDYIVALQFNLESSDGAGVVDAWDIVVGTSVEGGPFQFITARSTQTSLGDAPELLTLLGDVEVTAGPEENDDDFESPIRVAIGVRPLSGDARTYRLDNVVVQFLRADAVN